MKKKILLIEDDAELCEEVSEILKDEGYSVWTAFNGEEGQAAIENIAYDVIILDYKMPGLSGIDVLKFIRGKDLKPKILVTSGKPFVEKLLKEEDVSSLVTAVLDKPFDIRALLEKIETS